MSFKREISNTKCSLVDNVYTRMYIGQITEYENTIPALCVSPVYLHRPAIRIDKQHTTRRL